MLLNRQQKAIIYAGVMAALMISIVICFKVAADTHQSILFPAIVHYSELFYVIYCNKRGEMYELSASQRCDVEETNRGTKRLTAASQHCTVSILCYILRHNVDNFVMLT